MFRGNSIHTFDEKGRFIIPSRFKDVIRSGGGEALMLTRMEKAVIGYTMDEWNGLEKRMLDLASTSERMRLLRRYLVGAAAKCKWDKQGRVVIPPTLRDHAGLEKEIVLVGLLDHFEIWSRENWDTNTEQIEDKIQKGEMEAEIAMLGL